MYEKNIKVEPALRREFQKVKAIRLYPQGPGFTQFVNSTVERGETPTFLVKAAYSPKRSDYEIEIAFLGNYHTEAIGEHPYTKPPKQWTSWGEIVLSPEQLKDLVGILQRMQNVIPPKVATSMQPKTVQLTLGSAATIFDLQQGLYSIEVSSLFSVLGERKIITLLNRAKSNSRSRLHPSTGVCSRAQKHRIGV